MTYAQNTSVSVEKSRAEVERILQRYGANGFRYAWADRDGERIEQIDFTTQARQVRFVLRIPSMEGYRKTPSKGYERTNEDTHKHWERACRQRWRALCLAIKAKLEAVEAEISVFDQEFFANIVNPITNKTVYETISPQIEQAYLGNDQPLMLEFHSA